MKMKLNEYTDANVVLFHHVVLTYVEGRQTKAFNLKIQFLWEVKIVSLISLKDKQK